MRVPVQENGENMCSVRRNEKKGHASGQWQSKAQLTITKRQPAPKQVVQLASCGAHKLAEITLQKAPSSSRVKDANWARDLGPASDGISPN